MIILYKVCFNEDRNKRTDLKRPYIKNIQNMITVCLTSVIKQMSREDKIVLFLDGEDPNNVLDTVCSNVSYTINQYKDIGAAEINNKCIEYINEKVVDKNEIIYLCEDDYLHYSNCLSQMKDFFNMYPDYFCHPTDYPNIYKEKDFKQTSEIIVTKNCHWRSIKSTTYTFAFKKHLFNKWLNHSVFTNINNNLFGAHICNLLYVFDKCFSPIPSLTSHLEVNCLPPCVDTHKEFLNYENL